MNIGSLKQLDRRYYFLAFSILIFLYIIYRTYVLTINDGVIEFTVYQNKKTVKNIDQQRLVSSTNKFYVNTINFTENKTSLEHKELGNIGYNSNFFIDFKTKMILKESKQVVFYIYSDDGFNLLIDQKKILSYKTHRAIDLDKVELDLLKGEHSFKIEYYQGGGHLGIKGFYEIEGKKYIIGKDSEFVVFDR
ncbi:MAG: hypothetical protein U9Q33_02570 [Campylobacterota bacterium]|nr:hypothetical protein [Campylobacterota bacterium]